jgi:SAM-dependent methyltransferase
VPTPLIWHAQEQFEAFFLRPLMLSAERKGAAARALLLDNIDGITRGQFLRLLSLSGKLRHPALLFQGVLENALQGSDVPRKERIRRFAERSLVEITPSLRRRFLNRQRQRIAALRFGDGSDSWSNYYADIPAAVDRGTKLDTVTGLLHRMAPQSVLDLGCNTGVFSVRAAETGARVFAVDANEACVERLYEVAHRRSLPITPIVANVLCPTPAFGFLARQYPTLWRRVAADVVLCLGLMHHLHVSGRQSFDRIADLLHTVARKHVIFEFIGRDDANIGHLPAGRPIDYDLDTVLTSLGSRFSHIERLPSDRSTRMLLVCAK